MQMSYSLNITIPKQQVAGLSKYDLKKGTFIFPMLPEALNLA